MGSKNSQFLIYSKVIYEERRCPLIATIGLKNSNGIKRENSKFKLEI